MLQGTWRRKLCFLRGEPVARPQGPSQSPWNQCWAVCRNEPGSVTDAWIFIRWTKHKRNRDKVGNIWLISVHSKVHQRNDKFSCMVFLCWSPQFQGRPELKLGILKEKQTKAVTLDLDKHMLSRMTKKKKDTFFSYYLFFLLKLQLEFFFSI